MQPYFQTRRVTTEIWLFCRLSCSFSLYCVVVVDTWKYFDFCFQTCSPLFPSPSASLTCYFCWCRMQSSEFVKRMGFYFQGCVHSTPSTTAKDARARGKPAWSLLGSFTTGISKRGRSVARICLSLTQSPTAPLYESIKSTPIYTSTVKLWRILRSVLQSVPILSFRRIVKCLVSFVVRWADWHLARLYIIISAAWKCLLRYDRMVERLLTGVGGWELHASART